MRSRGQLVAIKAQTCSTSVYNAGFAVVLKAESERGAFIRVLLSSVALELMKER